MLVKYMDVFFPRDLGPVLEKVCDYCKIAINRTSMARKLAINRKPL